MRSRLIVPWLTLAAAVGVAAGCNSSSSNTPLGGPCVLPSGTQVALVYPVPNATAVPDNLGQVIVAAAPALPSSWNVLLTVPLHGTVGGSTVAPAPSPLPSPNATPSIPNAVYQASTFNVVLPSASLVAVTLNDTSSTCNQPVPLGSFASL